MPFCLKYRTRNKTTYNFCCRWGTKTKYSMEDIKPINKKTPEYKINSGFTIVKS